MNKIILALIVIISVFAGINNGTAQNNNKSKQDKNNYFVLTSNVEQLKPIILTAEKLALEDDKKYGEFHVVVCGKTVQDLADPEKMKQFVEMAEKNNVHLYACGFSLDKFHVDPSRIPNQFKVVENGILYGFRLQKKGFYSLSL
jgi:intracellular sulfur oxidation DsrE/DsrF family protein